VVHLHPFSQQVLDFLVQSFGIIRVFSLIDARLHHGGRTSGGTREKSSIILLPDSLNQRW